MSWWERFKFWWGREITGSRCECGGTWRYVGSWCKTRRSVWQCDRCDKTKEAQE